MPYAFEEFRNLVTRVATPASPSDPVTLYACALVAELAYHHVAQFEIDDRRRRALVVPCEAFHAIVRRGKPTVVSTFLRERDFDNIFVIVDRSIVVVGIVVNDVVFVGFRGTTFLFDWRINLSAALTKLEVSTRRSFVAGLAHRGFAEEALRISVRVAEELHKIPNLKTAYFGGHSLGGAVAALCELMLTQGDMPVCIFGSPRYCDISLYGQMFPVPTQVQRPGDIVPYVPQRRLGYADHPRQIDTAGNPIIEKIAVLPWASFWWRIALFMGKRFEPHNIEAYRRELGATAGAVYSDLPLKEI